MKTGSQGIPLNCSIVVPVSHSIKHVMMTLQCITLKINDQTFDYDIKVQVLKNTS